MGFTPTAVPCIFSPEQTAQMNLFPLFSDILSEYQSKEFGYSMVLTADLRKIVTKFARIWQKMVISFWLLAFILLMNRV